MQIWHRKTFIKLENVAVANALQLEAARRHASRSALFFSANFVLRICTDCYFAASGQNFDITIRFREVWTKFPSQYLDKPSTFPLHVSDR